MITLVAVANLGATALTVTVQRDWIVSLMGDNRGQLAGEQGHLISPLTGREAEVTSHPGLKERQYPSLEQKGIWNQPDLWLNSPETC